MIGRGVFKTDVREQGSGNVGATNVFRVLGKKAGILVFAADLAKGFLPAFIAAHTAVIADERAPLVAVLAGGAAVAGHTFSIFLKFRGGKGVATGGGVVIALMPWLFLLAFAIFWLVLLGGRIVSLASLAAALTLTIAAFATGQPLPYLFFAALATALIVYSHRSNIIRLAQGRENRVSFPWSEG